ncbi:peroxide stress protein YaaA [Clostridium sp. LBM24168]
MIWIISSAKSMKANKKIAVQYYTQPVFINEAEKLINELKKYAPPDIVHLMKVSNKLSEVNVLRYHKWEKKHDVYNSKQAISYYDGDVYKNINSEKLNEDELNFMQKHLRIISGLYGILKPLDIIQEYRLEMSIKLGNTKEYNLYEFWRNKITAYFNMEVKNNADNLMINLASREYYDVIDMKNFKGKIINIVFKEYRNGKYKVVPFNAKRARGLMVRYMTQHFVDKIEDIKKFDMGYKYSNSLSSDDNLVFLKNRYKSNSELL